MRFQKLWITLGALAVIGIFAAPSHAQLNSNNSSVALNASLAQSLTVLAGPATVSFTLAPSGTSAGSAPVSITTTWSLDTTFTGVTLYAYFSSANALTDGAGNNIPNTAVLGSVNAGAASAFTTGTPFSGNTGKTVFSQAIGAGNRSGSHGPDTIDLSITTTGLGLPAATYTGTLNIQAQAL
jgi:hypothetical protein